MKQLRSVLLLAFALLASTLPAHALSRGSPPYKNGIPWGNGAGAAYIRAIPVPSQIGIQNCAASQTDGFPPLTFLPSASGGCPPFGQDMNGILNSLALSLQWAFAGGTMNYDATFQAQIGGYPQGALVQSNILIGRVWRSTVDNNMTNPDDQTGATVSWTVQAGTHPAGTPIPSFQQSGGPPNAVYANGTTVGSASSNATGRANSDAYWLFVFLWTNCNTCSIFNSAGGSSTKGATAAADWAANKAMATPDMRGTAVVGAVDAGTVARLSGAPVISGTTQTAMSFVGETNNTHTLTVAEIPALSASGSGSASLSATNLAQGNAPISTFQCSNCIGTATTNMPVIAGGLWNSFNISNPSVSVTTTTTSTTGNAHNIVGRSITLFWYLQL